jgi:hypothetical protein
MHGSWQSAGPPARRSSSMMPYCPGVGFWSSEDPWERRERTEAGAGRANPEKAEEDMDKVATEANANSLCIKGLVEVELRGEDMLKRRVNLIASTWDDLSAGHGNRARIRGV